MGCVNKQVANTAGIEFFSPGGMTMAVVVLNLVLRTPKPSKSRDKGDVKSMITIIKKKVSRRCKSLSILVVVQRPKHAH